MSRVAIALALVATFLIGASLGLMGGILFSRAQHRPSAAEWFERGSSRRGPGGRIEGDRRVPRHLRVMPRLREALDLTKEQEATIAPLVESAHATMGAARESLRVRIDRVLTPEQRERWKRLEAKKGFPGDTRGPRGRAYRAQPGDEGEKR